MKFKAGMLVLFLPWSGLAKKENEEGERLFSLKINALLESKCLACHSAKEGKTKGDLDLSTRPDMLLGGESADKVLVPGHPEKSLIMTAIQWKEEDYEMPPKENDRLTDEQIGWIRRWIKHGAPWPDQATQKRYLQEEP
jgi:mono/diheme cytochrome c family protein